MAIVKMKKLQLMVVRSQKDSLLDELTRLGCLEITDMDEIPAGLKNESGSGVEAKTEQTAFNSALKVLDRFAPEKSKLLAPKPVISQDSFLSNEGYAEELEAAEKLLSLEQKLRSIGGEEGRVRALMESLAPWVALDMPLQTAGTKYASVLLGTMPAATSPAAAEAALETKAPEAELFTVSSDENQHYVVLVCSKDMQEQALEAVREFGFAQTSINSTEGTAAENIAASEKTLTELAESKTATEAEIVTYASHREAFKLCADRAETAICRAEAEGKLAGTESTVCITGWLTAPDEAAFAECAGKYDCAWETRDPDPEEYPDVPVKLKNNKITNALNMVTNMYALPTYDGVDPNPLMAPFFILFYGLMMADMGYGLLMIVAAIIVLLKKKPSGGTLVFFQLMLYTGISTFIMGICTASFFGDSIQKLGVVLGHDNWGMPWNALFDPMQDTMKVLIGAMGLGLIHLNTGMLINFVIKCKKGQVLDGLFEEGAQWVVLVGAVLFALPMLGVGSDGMKEIGKWILIVGLVLMFYGGSRSSKGVFGKLLSIFVTIYNQATGWLGDLLSYSRIMALMLAGAVIASVFNTIGTMLGNVVGYLVIFLIGHTLNFLLNLLSCYVHDLRLQCLEYFGKFYSDGGKKFEPISVKNKYYDIKN